MRVVRVVNRHSLTQMANILPGEDVIVTHPGDLHEDPRADDAVRGYFPGPAVPVPPYSLPEPIGAFSHQQHRTLVHG